MYTTLFWWMYFAGRFSAFCIAMGILFIIVYSICFGVRWACAWEDANGHDKECDVNKKYAAKLIRTFVLYGAIILSMCLIPNRRDVLTLAALRAVDGYNKTIAESNLKPDALLSTADHVVGTTEDVLNVIDAALTKAKEALSK